MQYFINSKDGSLQAAQNCNDKEAFFTVMSTAEFHECKEQLPYYKELFILHAWDNEGVQSLIAIS